MPLVVRDVMTPKPRTVRAQDSLIKAAKTMRAAGSGAVIVRENDRLCGMLTDRDIVVRALAQGRDPAGVRAGDICSRDVVMVAPGDDIDHAISVMRERHLRRLPVVEDGHPVGILSLGDLATERDLGSVLHWISGAPANR